MIRRRHSVSLSRAGVADEDVNPNSYINNIADCMLVLVLGFLVALVARYGVDLQAPAEEQEDLVGIEMNMDSDADGEIDDHFESAGTVYRDTQTGKYYLID